MPLLLTSHRGLFPATIIKTARETFGPAGRATSKSSNLRKGLLNISAILGTITCDNV